MSARAGSVPIPRYPAAVASEAAAWVPASAVPSPTAALGVEQAPFDGLDQRLLALRCAGREPHRLTSAIAAAITVSSGASVAGHCGLRHRRGQLGVPGSILLGQALGIGRPTRRRTLVGVDRRALPAAGGPQRRVPRTIGANGQSQATPDPAPKPSRAR